MITKISNKLSLLAQSAKLLVVGNVDQELSESIDKYFIHHKENMDITHESADILNASLYEQFDVVLFSFDKASYEIYKQYQNSIPSKAIYIITDDLYDEFKKEINHIAALLITPLAEEELLSKFFTILSINETENLLHTKEKVVNKYKNDEVNNEIDTFLDQYSGNIMFINDDLNENLEKLKDLELSHEIFKTLSSSLVQLSNIFKQNESLNHLSTMLLDFGIFLDELDIEEIEPSNFTAFDYLTAIIEDLTLYIDELFVYRLFKNVHLFEDSVENNINYFKMQLSGTDDDNDDNLEFF